MDLSYIALIASRLPDAANENKSKAAQAAKIKETGGIHSSVKIKN